MSENAERFLDVFHTACREIPDQQILVEWMIYTLGVFAFKCTEEELYLAERELWNKKQEVRH